MIFRLDEGKQASWDNLSSILEQRTINKLLTPVNVIKTGRIIRYIVTYRKIQDYLEREQQLKSYPPKRLEQAFDASSLDVLDHPT
jgi:hypothetical protein